MKTKHSITAYRLAQNELDQQVRENFGQMPRNDPWVDSVLDLRDALEVLAKIDQTEQEPVAWISIHDLYRVKVAIPTEDDEETFVAPGQRLTNVTLSTDEHEYYGQTPLYTSPPKREWMGLTFDEKYDLAHYESDPYEVVKNVEAKLKEKNHD